MAEAASVSTGIAGRYASAVFDIAKGEGQIDTLANDVDTIRAALDESAELRDLIQSPVYSRDQQQSAIGAIAEKMGLSATLANTLRLMASKRRLFVLPAMLTLLREAIASERGEVTAEVTSAKPLTDAQAKDLSETLKRQVGQDVNINTTVDESLIGGLIVKVGSRMIDTSIRSRLAALQNTMKEAR